MAERGPNQRRVQVLKLEEGAQQWCSLRRIEKTIRKNAKLVGRTFISPLPSIGGRPYNGSGLWSHVTLTGTDGQIDGRQEGRNDGRMEEWNGGN